MKVFEYNFGGRAVRISLSEQQGTIVAVEEDGQKYEPSEAEMPLYAGLISLALAQYDCEEVHDEEPSVLTFKAQPTAWNDPALQFTQDSFSNR